MSTNVIKQTLLGEPGSQTIKMVVRSNERGPKGEKGDPGPQGPQGLPGERGADGAIHYRAGTGIMISDENIIYATGGSIAEWGGIQGDISDQTDLQNALNAKQDVMADFVGTNGIVDGVRGAVPAPTTSKETCVLMGKGGWRKLSTLYIKQDGVSIGSYYPPNLASTTVNIVPPVKIGSTSGNVAQLTNSSDTNIYPVVNTAAIQDSAVTTAKINDDAVTTAKINDDAVTADKIDFTTFGTDLYTGDSNTPITLSDSAANYARIVIEFRCNNQTHASVDVYSPNNKDVLLSTGYNDKDAGFFLKTQNVIISDTTIDQAPNTYARQIGVNGSTVSSSVENRIWITKVTGYKF